MASKAKPGRTVGVYDRPAPPKWPKYVAIAVAVLLAIISIVVFMRAEAQPLTAHSNADNADRLGAQVSPLVRTYFNPR